MARRLHQFSQELHRYAELYEATWWDAPGSELVIRNAERSEFLERLSRELMEIERQLLVYWE